ncbi:MAG: hypothetical protein IT534_11180 [Bauldia sp.]|nr:hypothetical protein [Bauldia sp.]
MSVTTQEVAAAKAFLSELPLGIASATGIAAVRTLLASHENLELLVRSATSAAGTDGSPVPGDIMGAMTARVAKLKEALEARGAEAALLKDRNAATELRLQQALEEVRKRDDTTKLLEEERQRAGKAESSLRRAEERLRDIAVETGNAARRITELEQLCNAAEAASEREAKRADAAEAADRGARETVAERDAAIAALRARAAEQAGAAAESGLALERRLAALATVVGERDQEIAKLGTELAAERERTDELIRSGEAQSSYAATQQALVESLRRDLEERGREAASLTDRVETAGRALREARARTTELQDALTPFAEMAESYDLADAAWVVDSGWCEDRKHRIVVADFRAARSAALGAPTASGSPLAPDLVGDREAVVPTGPVREKTSP